MEDLFAQVDELDDVDVTSPYAPEGAAQVSDDAPIAFAELQVARPRVPGGRRSRHRDRGPRRRRRGRRADDRVRRRHVRRVRDARERSARAARGDHHPADRVRLGARDGPADRHRAVRPRHRCRAHRARQQRAVDARLRAAADRDDRPRRRHRLRAVHRHPLPRRTARGPRTRRRDRRRDRHLRPRGALRRHDGDHLAARPVPDGPRRSCAASRPAPRSACSS